jgi:hypothetical protein
MYLTTSPLFISPSRNNFNPGMKNELNISFIIGINNDFQWGSHPTLTFHSAKV